MTSPDTRERVLWIWRRLAIELPADWEMLQFSTEYNRGRCAFADRYHFRCEINWSIFAGEPDYGRMVGDYISDLERKKKLADTTTLHVSGWHGFTGLFESERTSRFGSFIKELGVLVECVLIWPDVRDTHREAGILQSIRIAPDEPAGRQRWRAFGMDMTPPAGAMIESCTAQPARAECSFTDPKSGNTWLFTRLGMVRNWLHQDPGVWLAQQLKPWDVRDLRTAQSTGKGSTSVVTVTGLGKPLGFHLRRAPVEATAWIDPVDGRLYAVRQMIRRPWAVDMPPVADLLKAAPEFTPRWT